jgi:hypothetical protein
LLQLEGLIRKTDPVLVLAATLPTANTSAARSYSLSDG